LRQVFLRVYRLEIASFLCTSSHVGIFNPALGSVLSCVALLPFSLVQLSLSSPIACVNKYTVYTYTVCKGGGGVWRSGPRTDKPR
jgi:hypothetical protein